ncbi:MAG: GNAT family N-acetyltransferase [Reichenbachiella sp.]
MIEIKKVEKPEEYLAIEKLAEEIWTDHYTSIIGMEQVTYMLDRFQSEDAMKNQVEDGYKYYMTFLKNSLVGYFSYIEKENSLFLSKFYIHKNSRGKGLGRSCMNFILAKARFSHLQMIKLTVNKNNTDTIRIYEKLGFKIVDETVVDIGNDFVMDDYVLEIDS